MKKISSLLLVLLSVLLIFTSCGEKRKPVEGVTVNTDEAAKVTTEGSWFLSAPLREAVKLPTVPAKYQSIKVLLPQLEETKDGITLHVDFFRSEYTLGGLIQAKITITNTTENTISYYANNQNLGCFHNGKQALYLKQLTNDSLDFTTPEKTMLEIQAGKSVTVERVWLATPSFFAESEKIEFRVDLLVETVEEAFTGRYRFNIAVDKGTSATA